MTADSENNVFGRTLNPHKLSLTAGGSTGGEGALIACRGSLLGACTDVAGSARIPALCTWSLNCLSAHTRASLRSNCIVCLSSRDFNHQSIESATET